MKKSIIGVFTVGFVGALAEGAGQWFLDSSILGWCWNKIKEGFLTLFQPIQVPYIVLAILIIMSGILLLQAASKLRKKELPHLKYIEGKFDGMTWRWEYGSSGHIKNLWCFCPDENCDTELTYSDNSHDVFSNHKRTAFSCKRCGFSSRVFDGLYQDKIRDIELLIDRNIRLGDYKGAPTKEQSPEPTMT